MTSAEPSPPTQNWPLTVSVALPPTSRRAFSHFAAVAVGENMADFASDDDRAAFRRQFGALLDAFGTGGKRPKTVVRGVFWKNAQKDAEMKAVSDDRRVPFVALDICDQPGMKATGLFKHPGVAAHPSDKGMAEIARRILNALFARR